jgi:hypothetical protein
VRFHVRGIDHLRVCGSSVPGELPEQVFPDAAPSPAHKAVIDRCRRTILRRAIAPATAALQYMHDAADDSAIVRPLDAPDIRRQVRFDPLPLLIAQPKQVPAHDPNPLPKTNQDRIVRAQKLMSSDPSLRTNARVSSSFITLPRDRRFPWPEFFWTLARRTKHRRGHLEPFGHLSEPR